jgi:small subunit ribosomal protein S20
MRSKLKTVLDKTNTQADADSLKLAYSTIDRAAKKRIIHKNKAARLKSALAHQVQSSTPQVKTPAPTKKASSKKTSKSSKK